MTASYRSGPPRWWQTLGDGDVALLAGHIVLGIWLRRPVPVLGLGLVCCVVGVRRTVCAAAVVLGVVGIQLSNTAWAAVAPDRLGAFDGVACLINDPAPRVDARGGLSTVAVFEIEGERFEAWARGSPRRRLADHLAGECARIVGKRRLLIDVAQRRAAIRHVVGGLDLTSVGDWHTGTAIDRASNRVRRLFASGARSIRAPDDALFAGLVIGDDRNEPAAMIDDFRASGLSHLTAVSGQNVAYVLAAAAPILRRLRPWWRWVATVGLIAWFVGLTRFEPSVLRAGVMAGIAATGFVLGREKPPARVLALAVGALVLIDPLLVWSVGFWLSVGATAGVALLGTRMAALVPGPDWIALPAGVTLGAQIGVAPVSLLVFGSLPLVSLPANLLAVPVAGAVMLYGLPAGLTAGAIGGAIATVTQVPSALGTRWVATIAALGARLEPSGWIVAAGWLLIAVGLFSRAMMNRRRRLCEGGVDGTAPHHR